MGGNFPTLSSSPTHPSSVLVAPVPATGSIAGSSKWAAGGLSGKQVVSGGSAWPKPGATSTFSTSPSAPASLQQNMGKKASISTGSVLSISQSTASEFVAVSTVSGGLVAQENRLGNNEIDPQQLQAGNKKKTKKVVPLFTNASGRSYR